MRTITNRKGLSQMGKLEDYTRNRTEGLAWALSLIEKAETIEQGVENLRKEVRFRRATFVPLEIPAFKIREVNIMLARRMLSTILVVVIKVLDDEYGWKKKRLSEFISFFTKHTVGFEDIDPYGDRYIELSDYAEYFKEKYDIEFSDEQLEEMRTIEKGNRAATVKRIQVDVLDRYLKNSYPEALKHLKKELNF